MAMSVLPQYISRIFNRISTVIVNVLATSAVNHGLKPRLGQSKDYKISCFFANAALKSKSNDWLVCNENNMSELSDMSILTLLLQ